jgi:hypothetical protein
MRTSENSTAIDRGPGPRSISDEFLEVRMTVQMLDPILCLKPPNECCTFWDPESNGRRGVELHAVVRAQAVHKRTPSIRGVPYKT